ncbi:hypothetical protein [Streptosporangium sp. NBC_01756]|uniref:hypothetical protein n=1 Tax=Streptosporangium sp. NBC_01756 TaxID=2975950 RepID=UPI002DD90942|nr:hypothetical protein [Streptosporangium sp. NBC_01756]WSC89695.1 hypothetical protein OIE48_16385 [Streptosporangium sp. NBC_01756]
MIFENFEQPLTGAEFKEFAEERYGDGLSSPDRLLLSSAGGGSGDRTPFGWSSVTRIFVEQPSEKGSEVSARSTEAIEDFRRWVGGLRDHDKRNLSVLGLDLNRLRKSAAEGRIYGYIAAGEPVGALREILDDPRVRTIRLGDVAFDLG